MNKERELELKKIRLKKIESRKNASKCPGVMNRLRTEIRVLEKEIARQ